ncbi:MAG: hypothetical protein JW885_11705 [Deltaproteobacteria bacterium]|nr:hypothetical protein [Candidatus Zymogenaceae bacterium]
MAQTDAGEHSRLKELREIPKSTLGLIVTILTVVTLLLVAGLILLSLNVSSMRKDSAAALLGTDADLAALTEAQERAQPGWVRSDFTDVQPLGWGFLLVDLTMEETEDGTTLNGSVINSTALDHYNATFRVALTDEYTGEFVLDALESGASDSFEVTIPDTGELSMPGEVRIIYLGSEVVYY